jgi:trehalose synthase-fused probable maltokinase
VRRGIVRKRILFADDDPLWYKDAVIYELHVKAFYDSTGDGTGDFKGLTEKLDYLENLGINAIWLLPFYPSPFRDDGYNITDYFDIHPGYGTLRDFKEFLAEAHRRGIRVITELVLNHTSDQHEWFQRARRAKSGSAARNYYVWSDTPELYNQAVITRARCGNVRGVIFDAIYDEWFGRHLITMLARRQGADGLYGELVAYLRRNLRDYKKGIVDEKSQVVKADRSNSSILYGNRFFLKLYRRLEEGIRPDIEITRYLTKKTAFKRIPSFEGAIEYKRKDRLPIALGMLEAYVPNAGDAWSFTLDSLGAYFEKALSKRGEIKGFPEVSHVVLEAAFGEVPLVFRELIGGVYLEMVSLQGKRTGEMHLALASDSGDPDFEPEPFSILYQRAVFQSMQSLAKRVF